MLDILNGSALREIAIGHSDQIGLCKTLERIANTLPHDIDPELYREAAGSIHRVMTRVVQVEQEAFAKQVATRGARCIGDLGPTIERLLRENAEDMSYAEELQETLHDFGAGHRTVSADALGYMLRGFFESRRRRIALEREIITALTDPKA